MVKNKETENKLENKDLKVVKKKSSYSKKKKLRKIFRTELHMFNRVLIIR